MPEMWQTRLPCSEETLRCMRLRRDYQAATLLMAKQEDQPDKNSLDPTVFHPHASFRTFPLWIELIEAVAYGRSQMSALQPSDALEWQTENLHLRHRRIHTR